MKSLAVILLLFIGCKVQAAPVVEIEQDDDFSAINVTFVPMTTNTDITLNPATGQTVSAASMPPATGQTDTAPTIQPITNATKTTIPVTSPQASTTANIMTTENSTASSPVTMTTMEIMSTTEASTTGSSTGSSQQSVSTMSSVFTTKTTSTPKQPTPKPKHGFDGGSFAGGIALGMTIAAIIVIAYRCYITRHKAKGYGDVN